MLLPGLPAPNSRRGAEGNWEKKRKSERERERKRARERERESEREAVGVSAKKSSGRKEMRRNIWRKEKRKRGDDVLTCSSAACKALQLPKSDGLLTKGTRENENTVYGMHSKKYVLFSYTPSSNKRVVCKLRS